MLVIGIDSLTIIEMSLETGASHSTSKIIYADPKVVGIPNISDNMDRAKFIKDIILSELQLRLSKSELDLILDNKESFLFEISYYDSYGNDLTNWNPRRDELLEIINNGDFEDQIKLFAKSDKKDRTFFRL